MDVLKKKKLYPTTTTTSSGSKFIVAERRLLATSHSWSIIQLAGSVCVVFIRLMATKSWETLSALSVNLRES